MNAEKMNRTIINTIIELVEGDYRNVKGLADFEG